MALAVIGLEASCNCFPHWEEHLSVFEASIFLSQQWLEVFKDHTGQPLYFLFHHHSTPCGVLAGLERPLGHHSKKQLFFFSGIATGNKDAHLIEACQICLRNFARERKYGRVIMKSYDYGQECRNIGLKEYIPFRREEYLFDLTLDPSAIIHNFGHTTRQKIRKAKEDGLTFRTSDSEHLLPILFELMECTCRMRTAKGYGKYSYYCMPFLDQQAARSLLRNKSAVLHYLEKEGQVLSMSFLVVINKKAYCIWMGTCPEGYRASAPYLLTHESLWHLKQQGFICLNLGGVPLGRKNQGIRRFKLNMGAQAIESVEQSTDFLIPPLSYLNHLMAIDRGVQQMRLPWKIKKNLLLLTGWALNHRNRY